MYDFQVSTIEIDNDYVLGIFVFSKSVAMVCHLLMGISCVIIGFLRFADLFLLQYLHAKM